MDWIWPAWRRENPIRVKSWKLFLGWLALSAAVGVKGYFTARGGSYVWMAEDHWDSLALMIQAVLLFSCLKQCSGTHVPAPVRWLADWAVEALMRMVPTKIQNAADAQCRDTKES